MMTLNMRSVLKGTAQRYKSLERFVIYTEVCDISSIRYAFSGVRGIYIISQPAERAVISHLSTSENISRLLKQTYRPKRPSVFKEAVFLVS